MQATEPEERSDSSSVLLNTSLLAIKDSPTGLGVFAKEDIQAGTIVLESDGPAILILREAETEKICAWCLAYNADEEWTVSYENCPGLFFCCESCRNEWHTKYREEGLEAYAAAKKFLLARDDEYVAPKDHDLGHDTILTQEIIEKENNIPFCLRIDAHSCFLGMVRSRRTGKGDLGIRKG